MFTSHTDIIEKQATDEAMTMQTLIRQFKLTSIAAALALSGCAAGVSNIGSVQPDANATTIAAFPTSAVAIKKANLSIDRWWTLFNDAALDRLMNEALARNEDLESAVARVREAEASLDAIGAAQSPTLDLHVDNGRKQQSEVSSMPLPAGYRRTTSHSVSLAASYEADLWGKLSSSTAAARSQLLASEWARASVEWTLTATLAETYFSLTAVDRQIAISEAVRDGRAQTLRLRMREHIAGAGNEFDLRRAESELARAEATLTSLARQRTALERSLTGLLGRTPNEIVAGELRRSPLDESKPFAVALPQGEASALLARRPDVKQAEAQLAAANASIDAARAAALPSLRLTGAVGSDARSISDLFSGPAFIWSVAASVTQSIVDGGKSKARIREEHARAEQALANYRKVIASAVLDVKEAYATLDLTHQAYQAQHGNVSALERARELASLGFENGALSYLDLLDAERNWHQALLDQVTAHRDQRIGQVAAFKALGGGYVSVTRNSDTANPTTPSGA